VCSLENLKHGTPDFEIVSIGGAGIEDQVEPKFPS
jgi:hypothetical protein